MEFVDGAGNRAAQDDEMEALQSIYGEDCILHKDEHSCEVYVHRSDENSLSGSPLRICVHFPESYPSTSEPVVEMEAPWLHDEARQKLSEALHRVYLENVGDVIIFTWIEWLKEQVWLWEEVRKWTNCGGGSQASKGKCEMKDSFTNRDGIGDALNGGWMGSSSEFILEGVMMEKAVSNEKMNDKNLEDLDKILGITHGAPFTEKKSTFQAHLAAVRSVDHVETVMEALLQNRKISGATHNIMAYRISIPEKNTVLQDHDDDGETAAGGRLLHLLQIVDAINVVVVVSRWFGGVLLGPDRFKHINNCARSLLDTCGYIKGSGQAGSHTDKKKSQSKGSSQKARRG